MNFREAFPRCLRVKWSFALCVLAVGGCASAGSGAQSVEILGAPRTVCLEAGKPTVLRFPETVKSFRKLPEDCRVSAQRSSNDVVLFSRRDHSQCDVGFQLKDESIYQLRLSRASGECPRTIVADFSERTE